MKIMTIVRKRHVAMLLPALLGLCLCTGVQAQKVYRCGSIYQDRPCDGATPGKTVRDFSQPADSGASSNQGVDASCAKRGADAQQIMWAREAGKTADALTAQATSEEQARLIADVYNRRGSALEVRNAVQANCMEEKAQAARAAAMISAALKAQGAAPAGTAPAAPSAAPNSAATTAASPAESQAVPADNRNRCASLNSQLTGIRNRQRAGGNAQAMDSLNQQRQTVEKALHDAGC
jgi:hypothetical protein